MFAFYCLMLLLSIEAAAAADEVVLRAEEVTFVCQICQTTSLTWRVNSAPVVTQSFFADDTPNIPVAFGNFSATLTEIAIIDSLFSNLTSTLTANVRFSGIGIECIGAQQASPVNASTTLTVPGATITASNDDNTTEIAVSTTLAVIVLITLILLLIAIGFHHSEKKKWMRTSP